MSNKDDIFKVEHLQGVDYLGILLSLAIKKGIITKEEMLEERDLFLKTENEMIKVTNSHNPIYVDIFTRLGLKIEE